MGEWWAIWRTGSRNGRRNDPCAVTIALGVCLALAACNGDSADRQARAAGPDPRLVETASPDVSTSSTAAASTAPPTTVATSQQTQPAAGRSVTTMTRVRAAPTTTSTGPVEFRIPPENLAVTEPPPLPSFA